MLSKNDVFHNRTRHIELKHHFIRALIKDGAVWISYVPTAENIADMLTKLLGKVLFIRFRNLLVS